MTARKEPHTILEGLTDHGYCRLDARTKVTRLLDGIKTDSLDAVKANIMQDGSLCRHFERCVAFYKEFIKHSSGNHSNESRRVSEVGSHKKGNDGVKERYYSKEEYKKLSTDAKEKLRKLREGLTQGGRPRGGGEKESKPHKKIRKIEQKANKLQHTIKKLESKRVDDYDKRNYSDSDDSSTEGVAGPNRNHPALMRQATGKGKNKRGGNKQE